MHNPDVPIPDAPEDSPATYLADDNPYNDDHYASV